MTGANIENTNEQVFLSQQNIMARLENVFGKHVNKLRTYDILEGTTNTILHPN